MSQQFPTTAYGLATVASPEEIAKERIGILEPLLSDTGLELLTDSGLFIGLNVGLKLGYTNPNLHRRIDNEKMAEPGSDYGLVIYDEQGNPYRQSVKIGVWDGIRSYRTTTTYLHDEESTTCEIP